MIMPLWPYVLKGKKDIAVLEIKKINKGLTFQFVFLPNYPALLSTVSLNAVDFLYILVSYNKHDKKISQGQTNTQLSSVPDPCLSSPSLRVSRDS